MTHEQSQVLRLVLMCVAWSIGQTLTIGLGVSFVDLVVPAALAIGVYLLTEDLARPRFSRGDLKYWRGRPVDDAARRRSDEDERRGGRWN